MQDLREKLEALSPMQRARLGKALDLPKTGGRLLAYVAGENDPESLKEQLRMRLPNYSIPSVIVTLDRLPTLPNGKVDRRGLPRPDIGSSISTTPRVESRSKEEEVLLSIWQDVLDMDAVALDDDFFEIGGDSILSIQIVSRARSAGIEIAPGSLADFPTVRELAASAGNHAATNEVSQRNADDPIPLGPIQNWFFELKLAKPEHWNQAYAFDLDPSLGEVEVRTMISALLKRHEQLRAGFLLMNGEWEQRISPNVTSENVLHVDVIDSDLVGAFSFDGAPLVRFGFKRGRLLLVAHHLVIDQVSWGVLARDIAIGTKLDSTPPASSTFASWVEDAVDAAVDTNIESWSELGRLPQDRKGAELVEAGTATLERRLDCADLFGKACEAYQTKIPELLFAALAVSMRKWTGHHRFRVGTEHHGRGDTHDLGDTVGWFTCFYPVRLNLEQTKGLGDVIKLVKERYRSATKGALDYSVSRYGNRQIPADEADEDILFNYFGATAGIAGATPISDGCRAPQNRRPHLLEINSWRDGDELVLRWIYNTAAHDVVTIERWSCELSDALRSVVDHCLGEGVGGFTPSDFAESGLDQKDLDDFLENL